MLVHRHCVRSHEEDVLRDLVELAFEAENLAPGSYSRTSWGTPAIDIPEALELQLRKAEVDDVVRSEICTMEDARYYSHRREMAAKRASGRFVGLVQVRRDTPF